MSNDIINSGKEITENKDEKKKNKWYDKLVEIIINLLFAIFLAIGIVVFIQVLYGGGLNFGEENRQLLPFVIIATSIVAGSFFIIKTYIKSEISVKEVEMGKEFRKDIKEFIAQQKIEFAQQNAERDRKFAEVLESIKDLKNEVRKDQGNKQSNS